MKKAEYATMKFPTLRAWEKWLAVEHDTTPGVWMKFAKKGTGVTPVTFDEALEVALCYGWIDGQGKRYDEVYYLNKFTPRGRKSTWSKINCEKVTRFIEEGKMKPSGLAAIESAKTDCRWDLAYDSPKNMVAPEDFLQALTKNKMAHEFYKTLNKTNTYAIFWRLQTAKKPETRERRMKVILEMLEKGEKFY